VGARPDLSRFVPQGRTAFVAFCSYIRSLHPPDVRIAIVFDNFGPPQDDQQGPPGRRLGEANNVGLAYVPFHASWLNCIEAQSTALRYFGPDGTDDESHETQAA
jgi:hypothetical protein